MESNLYLYFMTNEKHWSDQRKLEPKLKRAIYKIKPFYQKKIIPRISYSCFIWGTLKFKELRYSSFPDSHKRCFVHFDCVGNITNRQLGFDRCRARRLFVSSTIYYSDPKAKPLPIDYWQNRAIPNQNERSNPYLQIFLIVRTSRNQTIRFRVIAFRKAKNRVQDFPEFLIFS